MQFISSDFIINDERELGWKFHWLRAESQDPIDVCAQRLGVSVNVIDKIESGQFDDSRINLRLLIRYLALYNQKFHLCLGDD